MTDDQQRARDQFEEWCKGRYNLATRQDSLGNGVYVDRWVQGAWVGFRAALRAAPEVRSMDDMVAAYVAAVNEHLGNMTPKEWEIERFDPAASIARVARIGLTAALAARPQGVKDA